MRNRYTGNYEEPDERLMRSVEEKIDIPDGRKDDFRREIMNYIGALAIDGKTFDYKTNERLHKALELKLFEDQKDTIKLTSLVSNVVDKATQEKIDVVKSRLIRNYGYNESSATDVLTFVASIFARGAHEEINESPRNHGNPKKIKNGDSTDQQQRLDFRSFRVFPCFPHSERGRRGTENRTRSSTLQKAGARQGQKQLVEVHQPRRDDRQEGQGFRQHSAAADRRAAVPLRQQRQRRRRPG